MPILPVGELFWEDVFVVRGLMLCLYSVMFILVFRYLIAGAYKSIFSKVEWPILLVSISFFLLILALSQVSMQIRHKVMVMPLQYIIVSYGFFEGDEVGRTLGTAGVLSLILVTILKFMIGL
jgi:hypothetical protein